MSSLPWNAGSSLSSPFLPSGVPDKFLPSGVSDKKAFVLNYISSYKRLVDVRPASRLEIGPHPEMLSTGIAKLDSLTGGIPRGCLSEIYGRPSSGKTSVLLATIASATGRGESCVLIDASDSFDPESGAAAGVDFGKLLWVRCGRLRSLSSVVGLQSATNVRANDRRPTANDLFVHDARRTTHDEARIKIRSEYRLEQVLKTTDLVLQSGGFGLVVLDLAGIPEKYVRRIPLASWFRFQRAVEHTKTALLVVSEFACAQTCTAIVLKVSAFSHQPSEKLSHAQLLQGMQIEAEIARTRLERKPVRSVMANFTTQLVRSR